MAEGGVGMVPEKGEKVGGREGEGVRRRGGMWGEEREGGWVERGRRGGEREGGGRVESGS